MEENFEKIEGISEECDNTLKKKESVLYTKIFDTDFSWGCPYKIDVEKYKKIMGSDSRMSDKKTETVRFEFEYVPQYWWNTLYVWTNYPGIDDTYDYDCFMKLESVMTLEEMKYFVTRLLNECVIGIDSTAVSKIMCDRENKIKELKELNNQLMNLL